MDHGHRLSQIQNPYGGVSIEPGGGSDRFPQWSVQETRDFLMIRAELDPTFMDTKRNKLIWEMVSTRMKEMGYNRSPDQCKCKWKNLVTRYKGCETMETEQMKQQFPYYNDMQNIFTARMQRMRWLGEAEGGCGTATSSKKKVAAQFSSDEEDENDDDDVSELEKGSAKKKMKMEMEGTAQPATRGSGYNNYSIVNGFRDIMGSFMREQMEMEMQWVKAYEEREERRRVKEMEWRQRMEVLELERLMMERRWGEKEEERRIREEGRAEKREALITALLNKLN